MTISDATDGQISVAAYERHADAFLAGRDRSPIGRQIIERWCRTLVPGAEIIELACGGGLPVSQALIAAGGRLWAMDSSPTLLEVFRTRFPDVPVRCASVQQFDFFARRFDAAIAVGLMFLLAESDQAALIAGVAKALVPGGRFLFMAPTQCGTWQDLTTGITCHSLGDDSYRALLSASGFRVVGTYIDTGGNHYYDVEIVVP